MSGGNDSHPGRTECDAAMVFTACAMDTIEFCITDDILSLFHKWLFSKGGMSADITPEQLGEDMAAILAAARGESHPHVEYH